MVTVEVIAHETPKTALASEGHLRPRITLFHCTNAIGNPEVLDNGDCEVQVVKMPCSSMTREIFLLKAFEAGADAVVVAVCPEGSCRYLQGNIRAAKRVARVKKLLDEIGLGGGRLDIFSVPQGDSPAVGRIISEVVARLDTIGPNPAA